MPSIRLSLLILILLAISCKTQNTSPLSTTSAEKKLVINPRTELRLNSLGFHDISLHWDLLDVGTTPHAYQVLAATSLDKLNAGVGDLWNSGKRYQVPGLGVHYPGKLPPMAPQSWWKVRIWDAAGNASDFSEPTPFPQVIDVQRPNRIALIGGTMIANMDQYGRLETALTAQYPNKEIVLRNLGWAGDDVEGNARSEFGSALNTQSWQPPDREQAYGLSVLKEQINLVSPDLLIIGYGSEAAFANTIDHYAAFEQKYQTLLSVIDSMDSRVIILSPHRHWRSKDSTIDISGQNKRLSQATQLMKRLAAQYGYQFIDLYSTLESEGLTDNGVHLNDKGHQAMAQVILTSLELSPETDFKLQLSPDGQILQSAGLDATDFVTTSRGFRFTALPDKIPMGGTLDIDAPHLFKLNGQITGDIGGSPGDPRQIAVYRHLEELRQMIIEKNRLHRLRINPLNKVYTHLFRQHEMGHLAYETDDYGRLTEEKEELIAALRQPKAYRFEIELLDSWVAPRVYQDHEVPAYIPEPEINAELESFSLSDEWEINLFASDPMIANPISITWDSRGRAWIGTSTTYPQLKPGLEPVDKVVILEDVDHNGTADKHTVFAESLLIPHAVMPVEGGAYVTTTTELLFLADTDRDDKADSKRLIYSGFGHSDVHHTVHSMRWTPWGDLHFIQSIYINSFIDTPYGPRRLNGSGIWKYRPETERLEIFSRGLINPWGESLNRWGQIFATDGAGSEGPNYLFPGSAHRTAVGMDRVLGGLIPGKPKNTGAEVLSGSHVPPQWAGTMLANDFRANRTVRYVFNESGSGYEATEAETVVFSSHRSYRPVDVKQGPDGAIYIVDWYSPVIDHGEVDFYHPSRDKSHGRIWRLTAKNRPLHPVINYQETSNEELLDYLKSDFSFARIQANRELVRRNLSAEQLKTWVSQLRSRDPELAHHQQEALWLSVALNRPDSDLLKTLLTSQNYQALAAAIRMIPEILGPVEGESTLTGFVVHQHPQVRMEAMNALRRLASPNAVRLAFQAYDMPRDENLDYMFWLTARELKTQWLPQLQSGQSILNDDYNKIIFSLMAVNDGEAAKETGKLLAAGKVDPEDRFDALTLMANHGDSIELDMVLAEALENLDTLLMESLYNAPLNNESVPTDVTGLAGLFESDVEKVRTMAALLSGRWGIKANQSHLQATATDSTLSINERLAAADALSLMEETGFLMRIASDSSSLKVRSTAVAALAKLPESNPALAVEVLQDANDPVDIEVIYDTYIGLVGGADSLAVALDGVTLNQAVAVAGIRMAYASGRDLSVLIEAIQETTQLDRVGLRFDSAQVSQLMADVAVNELSGNGRKIFFKPSLLCASCHKVNGEGGLIGPDLSTLGTYMDPPSILESLIHPSSSIKQGYETVIVTKTDGSIVSGTLERRTTEGARIRQPSGKVVTIATGEIDNLDVSPVSLMPPGLIGQLRYDEVVDLLTYLADLGVETD